MIDTTPATPDPIRGMATRTLAPETKTCPQCSTPKPIDQFGKAAHRRDGRNRDCKRCVATRIALARANARTRKYEAQAAARNPNGEAAKRHALALQQRQEQKRRAPKLSRAEKLARKTARTVYDAIRSGARTRREIRVKTGYTFERIGDAIASLLTAPAKPLIRLERHGDVAMFFPLAHHGDIA